MLRIGIVGYSAQKFNEEKARAIISKIFDDLEEQYGDNIVVVSGLTAIGIPKLAYEEAKRRGWKTVGIACRKAYEYERFPVDEEIIVGENWGDESETFINNVDILIRIGGGTQSRKETEMAKKSGKEVIEFEL